jgi:hypothetical protein
LILFIPPANRSVPAEGIIYLRISRLKVGQQVLDTFTGACLRTESKPRSYCTTYDRYSRLSISPLFSNISLSARTPPLHQHNPLLPSLAPLIGLKYRKQSTRRSRGSRCPCSRHADCQTGCRHCSYSSRDMAFQWPSFPYPPSREGFWAPVTSTINWCEGTMLQFLISNSA